MVGRASRTPYLRHLSRGPPHADAELLATPAVEVRGVSKSFERKRVPNDVCFSVEPGSVRALLGPNGAVAPVVGAAWPLLASALVDPVWRWVDPWEGSARALMRDRGGEAASHVWPAALAALAWILHLSAYPDPLDSSWLSTSC
jgi:hypothetical protein